MQQERPLSPKPGAINSVQVYINNKNSFALILHTGVLINNIPTIKPLLIA